jgi:hypothetical protein
VAFAVFFAGARHSAVLILSKTHASPTSAVFVVSEAEAAAIRTAFDQGGELSAAVELRRLFPGVTDNAESRECARTIAGWEPLPVRHARSGGCIPARDRMAAAALPVAVAGIGSLGD